MSEKAAAQYSEKDLPAAGPGRYWKVEHHPTAEKTPVVIRLMAEVTPKRKALGQQVGFARTTASWKALAEAAELVLARAGEAADLVGVYDGGS